MLIMAEITAEMGDELRAAALANHTSVAAEVGRRLERLQRLEAEDSGDQMRVDWDNSLIVRNPAPDAAAPLSSGNWKTFTIGGSSRHGR
jgi:hypothetical protein